MITEIQQILEKSYKRADGRDLKNFNAVYFENQRLLAGFRYCVPESKEEKNIFIQVEEVEIEEGLLSQITRIFDLQKILTERVHYESAGEFCITEMQAYKDRAEFMFVTALQYKKIYYSCKLIISGSHYRALYRQEYGPKSTGGVVSLGLRKLFNKVTKVGEN